MRKSTALFCLLGFSAIALGGCNVLVPESEQTTDANFRAGTPPVTGGDDDEETGPFSEDVLNLGRV